MNELARGQLKDGQQPDSCLSQSLDAGAGRHFAFKFVHCFLAVFFATTQNGRANAPGWRFHHDDPAVTHAEVQGEQLREMLKGKKNA